MNLKVALLLFLVPFATAITTLTASFTVSTPEMYGAIGTHIYNINNDIDPMGDPVDGPFGPT